MLVKQFKFKRNNDKGGLQWTAASAIEPPGLHGGFVGVGNTLADLRESPALGRGWNRPASPDRLKMPNLAPSAPSRRTHKDRYWSRPCGGVWAVDPAPPLNASQRPASR